MVPLHKSKYVCAPISNLVPVTPSSARCGTVTQDVGGAGRGMGGGTGTQLGEGDNVDPLH